MEIPKKIYLQVKDDEGNEIEEVTWCQDPIFAYDIEYVLKEDNTE